MASDPGQTDDLLRRISAGDQAAFIELFAQHRGRLRRMVRLRLRCRGGHMIALNVGSVIFGVAPPMTLIVPRARPAS